MSTASTQHSAMTIAAMVSASAVAQALYAAVRLDLPDLMADGPSTATALAARAGCDAPTLHRLLRALASAGVCAEHDDGSFTLAELGQVLRRDVDGSVRSVVLHWAGPMWPVWGRLFQTVRTGQPPRALVPRTDTFESLGQHTEADRVFNAAMSEMSALVATSVAALVTFAPHTRLCDVGGGHGQLIATLLAANPTCSGILFDRPHVIDGAASRLERAGIAARCERQGGSFFDAVPAGADVYLLKSVLHDWDDAQAMAILRVIRAAMPAGARLLVIERVLPEVMTPGAGNQFVAANDLLMLLAASGRERTERDFRALLSEAGFVLHSCRETTAHYSVLEAAIA